MWKEIGDAFGKIGTIGDGCRCILMIGCGKGFCGGIDVTDEKFFSGLVGNSGDDDTSQDVARKSLSFRSQISQMQSAFTAVEECPVPVVAAIHGACIGAGIDLTCCADVRVCSPDAKFSIREVRLGLAADVGTLQRFPKLVGFGSYVRELCLTGGEFINFVPFLHTLFIIHCIL
jgi:delta(3,5)-delta(2,4)-dienoyl-CoA isomerase